MEGGFKITISRAEPSFTTAHHHPSGCKGLAGEVKCEDCGIVKPPSGLSATHPSGRRVARAAHGIRQALQVCLLQ